MTFRSCLGCKNAAKRHISHLRATTKLGPPPTDADKQEAPVAEELRRFALEGMADELEKPSEEEQS